MNCHLKKNEFIMHGDYGAIVFDASGFPIDF